MLWEVIAVVFVLLMLSDNPFEDAIYNLRVRTIIRGCLCVFTAPNSSDLPTLEAGSIISHPDQTSTYKLIRNFYQQTIIYTPVARKNSLATCKS